MEFVEGETLENLIKRSGRLEVELGAGNRDAGRCRLGCGAQAEARSPGHQTKQYYGELGGGEHMTAKIIDLGLAKLANEPVSQTAISTPGAFVGTPEFASPEQFAGFDVDIRSDLYSLGVMLWEMVTGHAVFRGVLPR